MMADLHDQEAEFARLLESLPCDDSARPEQSERLREQVLARFAEASKPETTYLAWKLLFRKGRELMRRPIPRLIAGATAAAVVGIWLVLPGRPAAALAFGELADAIVQAKTARFQMEVNVEGQPKQSFKAFYMAPGRYRQELSQV